MFPVKFAFCAGIACVSIASALAPAQADVVVLNPEADAHVSTLEAGYADTNFGDDAEMLTAGNKTASTFLGFDLSAIPASATITDVTLELYVVNQQNQAYFDLYRVTQAWSETEVTYNDRMAGTAWDSAGGDVDSSIQYGNTQVLTGDVNTYKQFSNANLLDLVEGWHDGSIDNHGLALVRLPGLDNQRVIVGSRESDNAPKLTVTYVPEPASLSLATIGMGALLLRRRR